MLEHVTYTGKPFYLGKYDKEIFPGHVFEVVGCPTQDCELAEHLHVRSTTYSDVRTVLYPGEYQD